MTTHKVIFSKAQSIKKVPNSSVDLIVTSPPYPMIEMWDEMFFKQNNKIKSAFNSNNPEKSFELMHQELDEVWKECSRTLKEGGIACINIGDATRTIDKNFRLFSNHSRIIQGFIKLGFQNLPNIIWRKQTNAPNKFMGSGMLPPGAYVTLEHEFILIFRKNRKREFKKIEEKDNRQNSSYFWEERNEWFSDLWNLKGTTQIMKSKETRERSAAYPFDLSYRLINMFSVQSDTVLDPFLGTGTTALSAMASNRNSIGIEIDTKLKKTIVDTILGKEDFLNNRINERLKKHLLFVNDRIKAKGKDAFKYVNKNYDFPVITKQELKIKIPFVKSISKIDEKSGLSFQVDYID